jgi:AcrR family transcriptional regulator
MTPPPGRASSRRRESERKPREERWSELIQVATEVFYERGYDAASLQEIAERLGMLKGSLYYYIQGKEDLLHEVVNGVYQGGVDNLKRLTAGEGNALERLREVVIGHVEYECAHLTGTSVFLHELDSLPEERRQQIIGDDHAYRVVLTDLLEAGQREGLIRTDIVPKLTALWILGSLNWVYRWYVPGGEFTPKHIGTQFADMIIRGLVTPDAITVEEPPTRAKPAKTKKRTAKTAKSG